MNEKKKFSAYPSNLQIAITTRCNRNCFICQREVTHSADNGSDVPLERIYKLKDAITNANTINLTGFGETFFHKEFDQILDFIFENNDRGYLLNFITNGSLLTPERGKVLAGRLNSMVISLNAATEETYKKDVGGSLEKVIERIKNFINNLQEDDSRRITLHYVVYKRNLHELVDFVKLAKSMNLPKVHFDHYQVSHEGDRFAGIICNGIKDWKFNNTRFS